MRIDDFLYWLLNETGVPLIGDTHTLNVTEGDINDLQGSELKKTPDGWLSVLVKFARNNKYWGLFRDYTVPMVFVRDGKVIITDTLWRIGYEAYIRMLIMKADRTKWPVKYYPWYTGELDLTTAKEGRDGITVNVMEGGLSKLLKAYENTQYEIELDDILVQMDGFFLDCTFNFNFIRGFNSIEFGDIPEGHAKHLVPIVFINGEGTQLSLSHLQSTVLLQDVSTGYETTSDQWFLKCFGQTQVRIHGSAGIFVHVATGTYTLLFRTNTGRTSTIYTSTVTNAIQFDFDSTFTVEEGENVFLEATWTGGTGVIYTGSGHFAEFKVDFKNRFKTTYIKAITGFNLFAKIVDKMTDGKYQVKSDFLTELNDYVLTCGDALRGLEGAVIKTNLADFYQTWFAKKSAGLGIENDKLSIEALADFFKETVTIDLGTVDADPKDFCDFAGDYVYNTIKAGGKVIEYNDVNGRFEFNQGQKFSLPVTRVAKELNLESPYRCDPFGIEFTRINFAGKITTDASSDNDTFILNIETVPITDDNGTYYKLNRPDFFTITGVPDPVNIFNVLLSPHRSVLNNGRMIHSFLDKITGVVKFLTGDKNTDLSVSQPIGDPVIENSDINIDFLGAKLFLPWYFNITTSVPVNLQDILKTNPYDRIKFTYQGNVWYGYLVDGGVMPATNDKQKWKLLAAPNNDMTKLIAA